MKDSSVLAALSVVARHHGIDLNAQELRRDFLLDEEEPPSSKLASIGRELGLEIKPLRMRWRDLARLRNILPAILRLKDGTALLLDAVNATKTNVNSVVVHDPLHATEAQAAVDETRLTEVWNGDVLLVKRHFGLTDEERPFGMTWLVARILEERRAFRDVCLSALLNVATILMPALVARIIVDRVMVNQSTSTLIATTVMFFFVVVLELVLLYLRSRFLENMGTKIDGKLNLYLLNKLISLPIDYFERNSVGRITSDLFQAYRVREFITGDVFGTILDLCSAVIIVPILFFISWQLATLVFVWAAIIFLIVIAFLPALRVRRRRLVMVEREKGAYLTETIYGMRTIKALSLESRRRLGWDPRVAQAIFARFDLGRKAVQVRSLTAPFSRFMTTGSMLVGGAMFLYYSNLLSAPQSSKLLAIGQQTVTSATSQAFIEPGLLIAFFLLAGAVASPLTSFARLILEIDQVRGALFQVASVVNNPPEETRAGTGMRLPIRGNINFEGVRFRYAPTASLALDDVSFAVPSGSVLGIMGRSGSGKTTITRLLQGLNQNYDGTIKVDGMDLREIDLHYLRMNIGVVAQENFLFTGTIRENISMAKADATMAEVVRAAQLAGAEEFIEKLPSGYNTMLSEGASNLSGGQRQRLAIARALILDPPVLILDEATSALDAESEAIINANLRRIAEGRTIICVSHRLSMLVSSTAILVMEKGKLYDMGTHDELLKRCDIYRHMWHQQNRHLDPSTSHGQLTIAHSVQA